MAREKFQVVMVEWVDALNTQDWQRLDDIKPEAHKVRSVGFLIAKNERAVVLAHGLDNEGSAESTLTIPRDWCQKIKRIA